MNLSFSATQAHVQVSSNQGTTLNFDLALKAKSDAFSLKSGLKLVECAISLIIHPLSHSPYTHDDGRYGEFRPFWSMPTKEHNLYTMWLHVPDDQFNTILFQTTRVGVPYDISIGVLDEDDGSGGLIDSEYDDVYPSIRENSYLPLRYYLFTMQAGVSTSSPTVF